MEMKVSHVKNPLSIIAIFAGIAEVCGTVVLPLIEQEVQKTFVWFLMLFPAGLVLLFFGVLLFKHHVLYAPSDYKNEDHFMDHSRPAKAKHVEEKRQQEIRQAQESSAFDEQPANSDDTTESSGTHLESPNSISTQQYELIEIWALEKFQNDLNVTISKNVKIAGNSDYIFDGIASENDVTYIFEIKLIGNKTRDDVIESWSQELSRALGAMRQPKNKIKVSMALVNIDQNLSEKRQDDILRLIRRHLTGLDLTFSFFSTADFEKQTGIQFR